MNTPNCPKCGCGERYVEQNGYTHFKGGAEGWLWGCSACGHCWWTGALSRVGITRSDGPSQPIEARTHLGH